MKWWNELPAKTQALIAVLSGISFLSIAIGLGIVFGPHVAALLILVPLFFFHHSRAYRNNLQHFSLRI